tara:strand:- start:847 stop:1071 length:225 start_codon:yes stop_codon:yes gene_type:complete
MPESEQPVRCELPPEIIAKQSVDRFNALATAKYMAGQVEHGGCLVDKVKLGQLEEEIIDLWHYVFALRLRLKDE